MYKLAITGGIGSGKTTVSEFIAKNYKSVYVFNADKESKKHLKKSLLLQNKIINAFGFLDAKKDVFSPLPKPISKIIFL